MLRLPLQDRRQSGGGALGEDSFFSQEQTGGSHMREPAITGSAWTGLPVCPMRRAVGSGEGAFLQRSAFIDGEPSACAKGARGIKDRMHARAEGRFHLRLTSPGKLAPHPRSTSPISATALEAWNRKPANQG